MTRKIIQIASTDEQLDALCDDGTVWNYRGTKWLKIQDIPQD